MEANNTTNNITRGNLHIGNNGSVANAKVETFMSPETKTIIESEFQNLGVKNWQELMANLINNRHRLLTQSTQSFPLESPSPKPKKSNTKTYLLIGCLLLLTIILTVLSVKYLSSPNQITFK